MTDRQLALLLRQIAGRVRALAHEIEPLIDTGPTETRTHSDVSDIATALARKTIDTTHPSAVWRVLDFAEELADEAELLKPTPEAAD